MTLSKRSEVLRLDDTRSLRPSIGVTIEKFLSKGSNKQSLLTGLNYGSYSKQTYAFNVLSGASGNEPLYSSSFFFGTDFSAFSIPMNFKHYMPLKEMFGYVQVGTSLNFFSGFNMSTYEARSERAGNNVREFSNSIGLDRNMSVGFNARIGLNKPVNQKYFGCFIEYKVIPSLKLDKTTADLNDELFLPGAGYGQDEAIFKGFYSISAGFSFSF
ncbi:MAG TPA: hypothetical protein VIN11_04810 [Roseivirga sp.]